jgi:hypothetical protein
LTRWNRQTAEQALGALGFNAKNRALAQYWLSLWDGDTPPARGAINPARMKDMLPGIAIFGCRPNEGVHCRLAGSAIVMGLGVDVTGRDLIAMTPPEFQKPRLERASRVALGAVSRRHQRFLTRTGDAVLVEDIQLPLSGVAEDGSRAILYHADWRPRTLDRRIGEVVDGFAIAEGVEYCTLAPI